MIGSPHSNLRRWLAGGTLAVGWAAALALYLHAAPVQEDWDVYDLEHSRIYERQLQVIGGKAAVMGKEIDNWIASLWSGRRLAYTIAVGTAVVTLGCWFWPTESTVGRADGPPRDRTSSDISDKRL